MKPNDRNQRSFLYLNQNFAFINIMLEIGSFDFEIFRFWMTFIMDKLIDGIDWRKMVVRRNKNNLERKKEIKNEGK